MNFSLPPTTAQKEKNDATFVSKSILGPDALLLRGFLPSPPGLFILYIPATAKTEMF